MIEKNTVILSLIHYLDLINENNSLKEKVEYLDKDNLIKLYEIIKLRKHILEQAEYHTIRKVDDYELSRIIDSEDWVFGLEDHEKLLELGFTMEELTDYIIERREYFENEEKENE